MWSRTLISTLFLMLIASISYASTVNPNNRTNGDQKMNGPADPNLMVMEKDTVQEFTASENPQPKAKPEKEEEPVEDEDESVSILSVNIIFEILSQFNLRDLLLPSK